MTILEAHDRWKARNKAIHASNEAAVQALEEEAEKKEEGTDGDDA